MRTINNKSNITGFLMSIYWIIIPSISCLTFTDSAVDVGVLAIETKWCGKVMWMGTETVLVGT